MKAQKFVNLAVGLLLLLLFVVILFTFQVRETEVVMVSTLGRPSASAYNPGLHLKWPWPIQIVQRFDKRVRVHQTKYDQIADREGKPMMMMLYAGWRIADPAVFSRKFDDVQAAERSLGEMISSERNAVVGENLFSDFVSTDASKAKFEQVEARMRERADRKARETYGVEVAFLGIQRLGLPESSTQVIFDRMKAERKGVVDKLQAEGESEAKRIRTAADTESAKALATAEARVIELRGAAEAEAAKSYRILERNPELAIFLQKLNVLESSLKERSTLILDERTSPFDLLGPVKNKK
jgi:membrane protease subunit HflC